MNIENFGEKHVKKPLHHAMLADNIRMLIVDKSGGGKTNLVVNLTMNYITGHGCTLLPTPLANALMTFYASKTMLLFYLLETLA